MSKKFFLICVLFGFLLTTKAQQTKEISFENTPLELALSQLSENFQLSIYFAPEWLAGQKVSGVFKDKSATDIINTLIENSSLNLFEVDPKHFVITRNTQIFSEVIEGFYRGDFAKANVQIKEDLSTNLGIDLQTKKRATPLERSLLLVGKQTNYISVNGYTLEGVLTELDGKTPLPNATVLLRGTDQFASSDMQGRFILEEVPHGAGELDISLMGYEGVLQPIRVYNNGGVALSLAPSYEALDEVVLEANANRAVQDVGSANSFNPEETKSIPLVLGERDLFKVATTLPGVSTAGEGAAGFNVRGGKTDQNLILLDRAVVYNPTHFFGLFPALNPFAIENLTVYKGAIPAQYGGRLSSVFELETKKPDSQKISGQASLGPVTANLLLEIPLKKDSSSVMVGARSAYANWIFNTLKKSDLENSTALFYDGIIKYQAAINDKNTVKATAYHSKDAFSISSDSIYSYENSNMSLQWQKQLKNKQFLNTAITHSRYGFGIDYLGTGNNGFKQGYSLTDTQLLADSKIDITPKQQLSYGAAAKHYQIQPGFNRPYGPSDLTTEVDIDSEQALEMALYLSNLITLSEQTAIELGLRYNFYAQIGPGQERVYAANSPISNGSLLSESPIESGFGQTYGGLAPRVSIRHLLRDNLSVKASFNRAYQFIHTLSNATTPAPNDSWKLSDNNIAPQQSDQFSLGVFSNQGGGTYTLSAEGFYKLQKNLLDFKTGASLVLNPRVEQEVLQGNGKAYGLELFLQKNRGKLSGWLAYTYSRSLLQLDSEFRSLQINNGAFFPTNFDKPHDLSGVFNYQFSKRLSFSANLVYQTGRPITFPVGNYQFNGAEFVLYSDRNSYRIPDYYRLDLGINLEGNHKKNKAFHGFWSLSVYNALGRNNPYSVFFINQEGEIKALQSSIFAVAVPSLTYTINF